MKTTAEMLEQFRRAREFGILTAEDAQPDLKRIAERREEVIAVQAEGIETLLARHHVQYVKGFARIAGPNRLRVNRPEDHREDIEWDRLILATGSRPMQIPLFPFDDRRILSTNQIFNLSEIPESIAIVGGGVIGCEFAFILASLGARVTVVEALSRVLPIESVDEDCSKIIQREMKKKKIACMVNSTVQTVEEKGGSLDITVGPSPFALSGAAKKPQAARIQAGALLICIGRSPNTDDLGLETIAVHTDEKGWIRVDDRLATSANDVYAIGDVLGPSRYMLAHVASVEGRIAAENALGGNRVMDYRVVPNAIFTHPEVACVGLTQAQAKSLNIDAKADTILFRSLGKAHVIGEISGQVKILSDQSNGRILGVHIVGPRATDLIAEGALAVQTGCTTAQLADTIHAHPTLAESMMEAALKATGEASP
jgi:dihydrolipoamide dehydrogenase